MARATTEELKARVSCVDLARRYGRDHARAGGVVQCPLGATNHKHGDRNPSCLIHDDGWRCLGCGAGGDVFALWAAFNGESLPVRGPVFRRAVVALAELAGMTGHEPAPPIIAPVAPMPQPAPQLDETHAAEAADLWTRATPASDDATLTRWLASRQLCSTHAAEDDLIRGMPPGHVPRWAYGWKRDGRALIPVFDGRGRLVSLRGRLLRPAAGDELKTRGAKGVATRGRLYANPSARRMLAGDRAELERLWDSGLVITEGDPDWLTLATFWRNDGPAVLGVWSGSSTAETLARVPDGCRVLLCPHRDASGVGYMRQAAAELMPRCEVWAAPYDGPHDYNDTLQLSTIRLSERLQHATRMGA